jgi:16S rRNA (adenine1518-N6/adenine1519-N6)-dimethyltransferase
LRSSREFKEFAQKAMDVSSEKNRKKHARQNNKNKNLTKVVPYSSGYSQVSKILGNKYRHAKKSLGQNFLSDEKIIYLISKEILKLSKENGLKILEVGPGQGVLTEHLINQGIQVLSVEKDDFLSRELSVRLKDQNFKLIHTDILDFLKSPGINPQKYLICGNLPFNISKKILVESVYLGFPFMIFMFQKEVGEDVLLKRKKGFLGFFAENYLDSKKICTVDKKSFDPEPKVDGIVVLSRLKNELNIDMSTSQKFFRFVRALMLNKRKKMKNSLYGVSKEFSIWEELKDLRAEDLSLQQLFEVFRQNA